MGAVLHYMGVAANAWRRDFVNRKNNVELTGKGLKYSRDVSLEVCRLFTA